MAEHVYLHVPFCAQKCPYCDFNSHAGRDAERDAYVGALLQECSLRGRGLHPRTVFVGGGTPTHLETAQLERLVGEALDTLGRRRLEEVTVEANPGSLDRAKVRALVRAGVSRLSLGVQSLDDRHLRTLGRAHEARDAVRSAVLARDGGLSHLSVDLILAIPGQTLVDQERDLQRVLDLGPEHVSAYVLTIEEGTVFERRRREGHLAEPDPDRDLAHLHLAARVLEGAGFRRYEISNFARPEAECRHNLAYWRDVSWIGLGAGAHSHNGARRWANVSDPATYVERMQHAGDATLWVETAPPSVQAFDAVMMGLRLAEGVDLRDVAQRTGFDVLSAWQEALTRYVGLGHLACEGSLVRLTASGRDLLSHILRDLLPAETATTETTEGFSERGGGP